MSSCYRFFVIKEGGEIMQKKQIHVVPNSERGGWDIVRPGSERASSHHDNKSEALEKGRKMARRDGAELIPHLKNGRIQNPDSFGHDPCPPRDRKH